MESPVIYPTVTLGGVVYTVRLSLRAQRSLEKRGIPAHKIVDYLKGIADQEPIGAVCKIAGAILHTADGRPSELSEEQILAMLDANEGGTENFGSFSKALMEGFTKVSRAKVPQTTPETVQEPAPPVN